MASSGLVAIPLGMVGATFDAGKRVPSPGLLVTGQGTRATLATGHTLRLGGMLADEGASMSPVSATARATSCPKA